MVSSYFVGKWKYKRLELNKDVVNTVRDERKHVPGKNTSLHLRDNGPFSIQQLGKDDLASLLDLTSKSSSGVGTSEKGRSQVAVALDWNSTCSSVLADVLFSACPL